MYKWDVDKYFGDLAVGVTREYAVAEKARELGLDPVDSVEIPLAMTMAEKCVALISTVYPKLPVEKISARILELESEEKMLRSLSHPNIVSFHEILKQAEKLYLVTEFLAGGDLLQRILDLGKAEFFSV